MKKFIFLALAVLGIALLAMVNVNLGDKSSNVSGVTLKNLEALSNEGTPPGYVTCYSTYRTTLLNPGVYEAQWNIVDCLNCSGVSCYAYIDPGTCQTSPGGGFGGIYV